MVTALVIRAFLLSHSLFHQFYCCVHKTDGKLDIIINEMCTYLSVMLVCSNLNHRNGELAVSSHFFEFVFVSPHRYIIEMISVCVKAIWTSLQFLQIIRTFSGYRDVLVFHGDIFCSDQDYLRSFWYSIRFLSRFSVFRDSL